MFAYRNSGRIQKDLVTEVTCVSENWVAGNQGGRGTSQFIFLNQVNE